MSPDVKLYGAMVRWRRAIFEEGTISFELFQGAFGRMLREATPEYAERVKAWACMVCVNTFHAHKVDVPRPEQAIEQHPQKMREFLADPTAYTEELF